MGLTTAKDRPATQLSGAELAEQGLFVGEGRGLLTSLVYERPVWLFDPRRVKDCSFGAFSYVNGLYTSSLYDCQVGRYSSIAEGVVAGAYEHPTDWLSSHPFLFAGREQYQTFLRQPEFERLAPQRLEDQTAFDPHRPTFIGHDVWIGTGAFIKRGVRIGDGAVVAAHSVVTHDVPAYALVVGQPAKLLRYRFDERSIERLRALQWWRYDLAPYKAQIDFQHIEAALDQLEQLQAEGRLRPLPTATRKMQPLRGGYYSLNPVDPLYP